MLQHSTCPRKAFLAAGDAITPPFPGAGATKIEFPRGDDAITRPKKCIFRER